MNDIITQIKKNVGKRRNYNEKTCLLLLENVYKL